MYSTTISRGVHSVGQLHGHRSMPPSSPPEPTPPKAPSRGKTPALGPISAEQVLIGVIALLLLQSEKKDMLLILALAYVFMAQ